EFDLVGAPFQATLTDTVFTPKFRGAPPAISEAPVTPEMLTDVVASAAAAAAGAEAPAMPQVAAAAETKIVEPVSVAQAGAQAIPQPAPTVPAMEEAPVAMSTVA